MSLKVLDITNDDLDKVEKKRIIIEQMKKLVYNSYGQYSVDTLSRAIPRREDSLKLSTRRIIWAVRKINKLTKSANVVGEVLGRLHPHGDSSVYGAMVNIASSRANVPLIQGKGNWGDYRNDLGAAAFRYTECMAHSNLSYLIDDEITSRAGVMVPNYSGEYLEPYYLNTKVPLGLLNGNQGIAVGKTVKVPSHNINEVIDASIGIIKNGYTMSAKGLAKILKGPDHRLYDSIMLINKNDWIKILETGNGFVQSEARVTIDESGFTVDALPYDTKTKDMINKIYGLDEKYSKRAGRKRGIVKKVTNMTNKNKFSIEVSFLNTGKKDQADNIDFVREFVHISKTKIFYNFLWCEQLDGEEKSLSDGSTYQPNEISVVSVLVDFQKRRRDDKLQALGIKVKELEEDLMCEDLKLLISSDSQKFFKLLSEAKNNQEAITRMVNEYKKPQAVCERVLLNSSFTVYINKQERILQTIEKIKQEITDTKNKIENIDNYLISELEELKSKIGSQRYSKIVEVIDAESIAIKIE